MLTRLLPIAAVVYAVATFVLPTLHNAAAGLR